MKYERRKPLPLLALWQNLVFGPRHFHFSAKVQWSMHSRGTGLNPWISWSQKERGKWSHLTWTSPLFKRKMTTKPSSPLYVVQILTIHNRMNFISLLWLYILVWFPTEILIWIFLIKVYAHVTIYVLEATCSRSLDSAVACGSAPGFLSIMLPLLTSLKRKQKREWEKLLF